jgi:hypothetical protein
VSCSRAHAGRFIIDRPSCLWRGGRNRDELSRAGEPVSTGYGTVGGFPKKRTPRGTPADMLTWGRGMQVIGTSRAAEAVSTPVSDGGMTRKGEARTCRSQARRGAHDRGRITEEPCARKPCAAGRGAESLPQAREVRRDTSGPSDSPEGEREGSGQEASLGRGASVNDQLSPGDVSQLVRCNDDSVVCRRVGEAKFGLAGGRDRGGRTRLQRSEGRPHGVARRGSIAYIGETSW